MKKMKSKKLNSVLIAATLSASIVLGGTGAALINNKMPALNAVALDSNYEIQAPAVAGNTYYVAPGVANAQGTGTNGDPYNLSWLLRSTDSPLGPGDTVLVKSGTYEMNERILIDKNGEYNKYITVKKADPAGKAVLSFYEMRFDSNNRGVQLDADFWHWDGVDICGAGDNGMYVGGSYNVVENCEFYDNRDTGLQLGRKYSPDVTLTNINDWPCYNLIKNCTSYNNYDNETYGENADGFAAKLTVGYGNIFDGCIAYRNSDDGWDLYAKTDSGNIGAVIIYNCVAFENGFLAETQAEFNSKFVNYNHDLDEDNTSSYLTRDGDGNGFKLGGSVMEGDVYLYNSMSFNNRMHGVTDNSNPGVLSIKNVTSYNNSVGVQNVSAEANFGEIVLSGEGVNLDNKCGNINLARQTYSYNLMSRIVSVNDGITTVGSDEYRGSAEYSYFDLANGKAYKVEECVDASNRAEPYAQKGTSVPARSADIFAEVPSTWGDAANPTYTYNLSGKGNKNVHKQFRNADNSVNMHNMLKIQDYTTLFGDTNKIGADLTKSTWSDYTHYSYFNASNADSAADAAVKSAIATLDLNTNVNATFQDFDLIVSMKDVSISWQSSDNDTIKIVPNTVVSPSGTNDSRAVVYRGAADKTVKLTATVTHKTAGISDTKEFTVVIKKDVPTIGDAVFEGVKDGRVILDQYSKVPEPAMTVRNGADYNGKLLDPATYSVETVITYGAEKTTYPAQIHHFTTSVAGVYGVSKQVTLGTQVKNFNYTIYVASPTAQVDFVGAPAVTVNQHGYTIGGEVSSATGKLYSYSSPTAIAGITAEQVIQNGVGYEFRNDNILFQFESDNSSPYYVYYVMCNLNGDVTSEVTQVEITTQNITNATQFKAMLLENNSSTIYMLKNDIDLSGEKDWVGDITSKRVAFKGVLNGLGHTISGLNVAVTNTSDNEQGAMFYRLEGGTIENIKFHDITIKGNEKTGLIATTYGGYLYNIELRNIYVEGSVRVGGLVGQAMNGELHVDQVSLINDAVYTQATAVTAENFAMDIYYVLNGDNYEVAKEFASGTTYYTRKIDITGARSAGIIGFIQASKATDSTQTYLSNIYVDAVIGSATEQYVGSIVGSADDRNVNDYLEITDSYSIATLYAKTYMGGMLGSHNKGTGAIKLNTCVYFGTLYYAQQKSEESAFAVKNCSGIVGRFVATARADVKNCYAKFDDYNSNFDVNGTQYTYRLHRRLSFWQGTVSVDEEKWTILVDPSDSKYAVEPFIQLKFLGEWN